MLPAHRVDELFVLEGGGGCKMGGVTRFPIGLKILWCVDNTPTCCARIPLTAGPSWLHGRFYNSPRLCQHRLIIILRRTSGKLYRKRRAAEDILVCYTLCRKHIVVTPVIPGTRNITFRLSPLYSSCHTRCWPYKRPIMQSITVGQGGQG